MNITQITIKFCQSNTIERSINAPNNVKLEGRPGIGGGFELKSDFLFKGPDPGKSSWVKKVQIPHSRGIVVRQKTLKNDQKSLPRADL